MSRRRVAVALLASLALSPAALAQEGAGGDGGPGDAPASPYPPQPPLVYPPPSPPEPGPEAEAEEPEAGASAEGAAEEAGASAEGGAEEDGGSTTAAPARTAAPAPTRTSTSTPPSTSTSPSTSPSPATATATATPPAAASPAPPEGGTGSAAVAPRAAVAAAGAPRPAAPAPPPVPGPAAAPTTSAPTGEAEAAAERALERALVQKGGLVVPEWGVELVPEISFAHADGTAPAAAAPAGAVFGARSETFTASLALRVGLPFDTQVEVSAPFVLARLTPGGDEPAPPAEGSGIGDVQLAFTWHALGRRGRLPDVLVGGFWKTRSGRTAFDDPDVRVPLGSGVEQFGGTLALVKAADPLVLLATGSYAVSAPRWIPDGATRRWLEAGDEFGGSAGAVLAVSPETSLSFALEASHARPLRLDGETLYRTDRTSAVFRVGVATLLSRSGFLQVNLGMGLTSDVPQFEVSVATPLQF